MRKSEIERMFHRFKQSYKVLRSICESRAIRWEWTSFVRYRIEPFYFERYHITRGKCLKAAPKRRSQCCQYGFDSMDRVIIERHYIGNGNQFEETFCLWHDDRLEVALYDKSPDKELVRVELHTFRASRLLHIAAMTRNGRSSQSFEYRGNRLARIVGTFQEKRRPTITSLETISYDASGSVTRIEGHCSPMGPGRQSAHVANTLYQRRTDDSCPSGKAA